MRLEIKHLTKVEGHGSLLIDTSEKEVKEVKLNIFEGSRFFESFMRGRSYQEAPEISSRICGICTVAHSLAALKTVEAAVGISPSDQTIQLRKLMHSAATIQSHILHLYFLALPDYFGYESALAMVKDHPEAVKRALRMKQLSNKFSEVIGGRAVHPITPVIGGFSQLPTKAQLKHLTEDLKELKKDAAETIELMRSIKIPEFSRKVRYLSLFRDRSYPLYEGDEISSGDSHFNIADYRSHVREFVASHSTAKHSVDETGKSFMVGALARANVNGKYLSDAAKEAVDSLGIKFPNYNSYNNNSAQAVEVVQCLAEMGDILEKLLHNGIKDEKPEGEIKAGEAAAAVEAPRGTLYHYYKIDDRGRISDVDVITPTAQNLKNAEEDIRELVPQLLDLNLGKEELMLSLEELVRAYDPCISCSTHFLEVKFT
jgi:coenzyme F420-reducing hydrogenase alpha subunit